MASVAAPLTKSLGLFFHYRLLDDANRYGKAGWDWPSTASVSSAGTVEVRWTADDQHPLDMAAEYRWAAADTLDLTTRIRARKDLRRFEVFLASYFEGFPETIVHAGDAAGWLEPEEGGRPVAGLPPRRGRGRDLSRRPLEASAESGRVGHPPPADYAAGRPPRLGP